MNADISQDDEIVSFADLQCVFQSPTPETVSAADNQCLTYLSSNGCSVDMLARSTEMKTTFIKYSTGLARTVQVQHPMILSLQMTIDA